MCHFLSFVITKGGDICIGQLDSHSGIEKAWNLKPDSYREAEWIGDDPSSLTVRVTNGEDENWFRSAVLAKYATRSEMLKDITTGKANGNKFWYLDGKRHRVDGPAIEYADGDKYWYLDGKCHRVDGPAVEWADGDKFWYLDGKRHRVDGPAIEYADGTKFWYLDGKFLTEEEHRQTNCPDCDGETVVVKGVEYVLRRK